MKIRLASDLQSDSIVDGEGIRTVIWTQGCPHHCPGCHNPETHDFNGGKLVDIEELKKQIFNLKNQDGITISGGEPFSQIEACMEIAKFAKSIGLNVWCYTGYTFEELLNRPLAVEFLKYIDVLVDGKFILSEKSLNLKFRGSKNQRIINVKRSLREKRVCTIRKYNMVKHGQPVKSFNSYIFI